MDVNSQVPGSGSQPGGIAAITLFVEDLPSAREFYAEALGLRLVFEDEASAVFDAGSTVINLLAITQAPELIAPATVAPREAGSRYLLTIEVDDVDATCAALTSRGVALVNGPMDRPWGRRTASFSDPAGHMWEIAAKLP
jgi:catechol 2,3-dioxygenase-like lactoylglutathione lyase family enzyme